MNYIKSLQAEIAQKNAQIAEAKETIQEFLAHLNGPKFTGVDSDGSRKDWISTADVIFRLQELRSILNEK